MKPSSLSVIGILTTLLAVPAAADTGETYSALTYVAPGVNVDIPAASSAFYDNGKGAYFWGGEYWEEHKDVVERLYHESGDNYNFLGQLADKVDASKGLSPEAFAQLVGDENGCWYNADSNVLQYWQDHYKFALKQGGAPDGYTYSPTQLEELGGTQSLQIDMLFYQYAKPSGGSFDSGFDWYLGGKLDEFAFREDAAGKAGFYTEYYYGQTTCTNKNFYVPLPDGKGTETYRSMTTAAEQFIAAFGLQTDDQGNLVHVVDGQIATLSLRSGTDMGHEITCYGFTLNSNNELESVYIADNQDGQYRIEQVFLQLDENQVDIHMYADRECKIAWEASGYTWKLLEITSINTPAALREAYNAHRETLVKDAAEMDWGRDTSRIVQLTTPSATISCAAQEDSLYAGTVNSTLSGDGPEATLQLQKLVKQGDTALTVKGLNLAAAEVAAEGGSITLANGTVLDATGSIGMKANARIDIEDQSALNYGGVMKITANKEKTAGLAIQQGMKDSSYTMGNQAFTISDATITMSAAEEKSLGNRMVNVNLVNTGASITEVNAANTAFGTVEAAGGDITFLNKKEALTLTNLTIGANLTVSVYRGEEMTEQAEGDLFVTGKLVGLQGATLNANLWLNGLAMLDVAATQGQGITMGSDIHLAGNMLLSENDLSQLGEEDYVLFTDVERLYLGANTYTDAVDANLYFSNLDEGTYWLTYNQNAVYLSAMRGVPEPATGTLTLFALAGLCARRRRK